MHKHSEKLKVRIHELAEQQVLQEQQEKELLRKRFAQASGQEGDESPSKVRKSRQGLFDPIRRWNSFHNSRDKKSSYKVASNTNLPYLQNLVQFKQQHSAKINSVANEKFPFDYTTSSSATSSPTLVSKGIKTVLKTSSQITNMVTDNSISSSLSDINCFKSPTKKQFSSPNLFLDPNKLHQKKSRRTSSDCYQNVHEMERYTLSKNLSSSNPDDLVNLCPTTANDRDSITEPTVPIKYDYAKNKNISVDAQKFEQAPSTYQKYSCSSLTNSPVKFPKLPHASCDSRKHLDPNAMIRAKDMCSNMDENKRLEISRIMDDKRRKSDFTIDEIKRIIGDARKIDDLRNDSKTIDEDSKSSSETSSEHSRKSSTQSHHEESFNVKFDSELTKKIVTILQGDEKYFTKNLEETRLATERLKRNLSIKLPNESNKSLTPSCSSLTPLSTPSTPVIMSSTSAPLIGTTLPIPIVKTVQTPRIKALRSDSLEAGAPPAVELATSVPIVVHRNAASFGKRTGGSARRPNECFVLEPSEMIVIDYPEVHQGVRGGGNARIPGMDRGVNIVFDDAFPVRPELFQKSNRSSHSSDTSSAYSGSDTMASVHSSVEADEVDLSGLIESVVDSDEEDLGESHESLMVKDRVRECLEKDPSERSEEDIEQLLDFTQHLKAFTNMTLAVRKALCGVMVFAVVEKAGTIVMNDGEELDSWSVVINGCVEVELADGRAHTLQVGDSFGILPTMEKLYHEGVMRTRCDDCQFVCITQTDYYRIQHQGEENTRRHEDSSGRLVMVTETRGDTNAPGGRRGTVVIRGTPDRLMLQLIEENSVIDPTYVEDFLLTHRTFIGTSIEVAEQLLRWFQDAQARDRVTRVVLLWVNNHFTDFETDPAMMAFLERFEAALAAEHLTGELRLLNIACAAKARARTITLARPSRDAALQFHVLGGYERGARLFISQVEKGSKAEDVGLKRGDQILEVNGQSFRHVSHARALDILRGATHLSITVKSNLLEFKQLLSASEEASPTTTGGGGGGGRSRHNRGGAAGEIARLQSDPRARDTPPPLATIPPPPPPPPPPPVTPSRDMSPAFLTLGPRKRLQKVLQKIYLYPKNAITDVCDDSSLPLHSGATQSSSSLFPHSHSNPDLMSICYPDLRTDYPEHVLKVYKSDQTCKYLLVHEETTAHEVVMLALQEFGITEPSSHFSLCEVSVAEGGFIKQRRLPDQLQNLAERIGLSSRYYLKTNGCTEALVGDDLAAELVRESQVHFLQLNAVEVATQLTLQDYAIFRRIEATEYVDDLFELKSGYGVPMLSQFAELVNREMFWVVTEVCSEPNLVRRSKVIKQFVKVARQCKECRNFNSMFAIVSGLGHGAVSRLRTSWEKLPSKYQRLFQDLQDLMDPSRNMSKYRQLVSSEQSKPPIIPFYPVVKKDLTFIHLGNDSKVEGLINFEKLRMIAKEVRALTNMCSAPYDLLTMLELGGQPASNAMVTLNQLTTGGTASQINAATVKRRKKSTGAPNPKKMFEEAQMVRRVKAYLAKMKVITDEDRLHALSGECEGSSAAPGSGPLRKRHPSPTLSTASTTSSASEGRKPAAPKFGSASPQAVRKLLSLSEPGKTRLHQPRHPAAAPSPSSLRRPHPAAHASSSSAAARLPPSAGSHERCHSDQGGGLYGGHAPLLLSSVDLNAESSSVTSLSNLPLRKTVTSGSVTSTDSGHSTQLDSHSNSSGEVPSGTSPPLTHRRHSMQPPGLTGARPPFPHAVQVLPPPTGQGMAAPPPPRSRPPPSYSVAAQVAARINLSRLGRAHSHEGVTSSGLGGMMTSSALAASPPVTSAAAASYVCARHRGDEDDEDDDAQVSAV